MPSSESSGTQSATVTTEHTLHTTTNAGSYVLMVNLTNMVAADELELTLKAKVLTGGSEVVAYRATYAHAQAHPLSVSVPLPSLFSLSATLKQTAGTSRDFEWQLVSL